MHKFYVENVISNLEKVFNLLETLESILSMIHRICLEKEILSIYYNLEQDELLKLSQERNDNINMLEIAINKVKKLKQISQAIEDFIIKPLQ